MPASRHRRSIIAALVAGLGGLALLASVGPSRAADPEAPHHAPAHWLPNEEWVWQHWLPYDEQRLYSLLGISRRDLWQQLRDDTRTVAALGKPRGWRPKALADALVAPRRGAVSAAKYDELRSRSFRTLTQGHLAQHIFFHSLHQSVLPDRASRIFGARSTNEFQRLRRAELSPLQISRLFGRSRAQVEQAAVAALRERARAGVRGGDVSSRQAAILFSRQLRQLPRWLGQSRYNGPPPLYRNPNAVTQAKDYASNPSITANGGSTVFEAYESSIPLAKKGGEINVRVRERGAPHSRLVSLVRNRKAPRSAYNPSASADGRYVAFESSPGNLNFAKRYGGIGVVVRDMAAGKLVAVDPSSGADARRAPRSSYNPSISADGRFVAFESSRQVRRSGRYSHELAVLVRDLRMRRTRSVRLAGRGGRDVSEPSISGDGRYVAFTSTARIGKGRTSVLVKDLRTGSTELVSRASGRGGETADGESYEPAISYDGRYVAFTSTAPNLGGGAGPGRARVFLRDRGRGETGLVSTPGAEGLRDAFAFEPAISRDGRFVAFAAASRGDGADAALRAQVFLRDMRSGAITLVSHAGGGESAPSKGFSFDPAISADGRYIAFTSDSPELSDRKFDPTRGVFAWDKASAETKLVSKGFTVERSSTRRLLGAAALALFIVGLAALARRVALRRRRLAVAGAG